MSSSMAPNPTSICFCVPMARAVFEPGVDQPFGGSEVRAYWFAKGLAKCGWSVEAMVNTHGETSECECIDGVSMRYFRMPTAVKRLRDRPLGIQSLWELPATTARRGWRSLVKRIGVHTVRLDERWAARLSQSRAAWFACFGVHAHAAATISRAKQMGRLSVLFLASDTDVSTDYLRNDANRNAYGQTATQCLSCLENADVIVAQTESQRGLLSARFGRDAIVIPNPIGELAMPEAESDCDATREVGEQPADVLWIGRADCFSKRADLALELARRSPQLRFTLIMNQRDPQVFRRLMQQVPNNARVIRQVPWRAMDKFFRSSRVLLNTSDAEGFPNAFLQAAQHGRAILTLNVDPNQMLSRHHCGWCAGGDIDSLVGMLEQIRNGHPMLPRSAVAGPRYVERFHNIHRCCSDLDKSLKGHTHHSECARATA